MRTERRPALWNPSVLAVGYFCIAIPGLFYLSVFQKYAINMPFFDDYPAVLVWMHQFLSSATAAQKFFLLFQQYNEHRIAFDYLVVLLCLGLFHQINFVFLSFVGSLGLFGIVAAMLYAGRRARLSIFELIPVSIILFTLSQNQMISCAMTALQQYWQLLFDLLSIILLTGTPTRTAFAGALLFAIAATFSGGGGLLVFPVGLFYLALSKQWRSAAFWTISAALILYIYFIGLQYAVARPDIAAKAYVYSHPGKYVQFLIRFLGNFSYSKTSALNFGSVLVLAIGTLSALSFRKREQAFTCILMFILASACVVGLARTFMGQQESLASRYTIYGLLTLAVTYMMSISIINDKLIRRIASSTGIAIAIALYVSWINPALTVLGHFHNLEKTELIWKSQGEAGEDLQTAMQEHVFYPHVLDRHLPEQIRLNTRYGQAWDVLFEIYLTRIDLRAAFPLGPASSYTPLLSWAAAVSPGSDPTFLRLQPFQPLYKQMVSASRQ